MRFESLDLPLLPADRSDFDVHGALEDDKVKTEIMICIIHIIQCIIRIITHISIISIIPGNYG